MCHQHASSIQPANGMHLLVLEGGVGDRAADRRPVPRPAPGQRGPEVVDRRDVVVRDQCRVRDRRRRFRRFRRHLGGISAGSRHHHRRRRHAPKVVRRRKHREVVAARPRLARVGADRRELARRDEARARGPARARGEARVAAAAAARPRLGCGVLLSSAGTVSRVYLGRISAGEVQVAPIDVDEIAARAEHALRGRAQPHAAHLRHDAHTH